LQAKIDRLEQMLLNLETGGYVMKSRPPEPELKVEVKAGDGRAASENFLSGMMNL